MDPLDTFQSKFNTPEGKAEILLDFSSINEAIPLDADRFFGKYGGGYWTSNPENIPHNMRNHQGRIHAYFDLFDLIKSCDPIKFTKIHKGTPYCILGWLFIDIGDYEKGIFYIDAAVSEDIRIDPFNWFNRPASSFIFLDTSPGNDDAKRFTKKIKKYIKDEVDAYNSIFSSSNNHISMDHIVEKFVRPRLRETTHRTLISSLYIFLFEAYRQLEFIKYRSENKGSIEPFLSHLHRGSLLLESVLKEIYTSVSDLALGNILKESFVKEDLTIKLYDSGKIGRTLNDIIDNLLPKFSKSEDVIHNCWFTLALKLRNTTSHSLLWPDIFNEEVYISLYRQILFSIFFLIKRKYR